MVMVIIEIMMMQFVSMLPMTTTMMSGGVSQELDTERQPDPDDYYEEGEDIHGDGLYQCYC